MLNPANGGPDCYSRILKEIICASLLLKLKP
jgi:hypothetical protein